MSLSRGLYDLVLTEAVARALEQIGHDVPDLHDLDNADTAERLIEVLGRQLRSILDHLDSGDEGPAHAQLALVNGLLAQIRLTADRSQGVPPRATTLPCSPRWPIHCREGVPAIKPRSLSLFTRSH